MSIPEAFAHEYDLDRLNLTTPCGHDFRMYITPRHRHRYENESYQPFCADLLSSILRGSELFVDIGAEYGFFSLLAASRNPKLQVISVEPTPMTCRVLAKNVKLMGFPNVAALELAASDFVGDANFHVSAASDNCGLFEQPTPGSLHSIKVRTTTVDALLDGREPCPLIVKISTEGNELAVLKGMKKTFERFRDIKLVINFSPASLRAANVEPAALLHYLDELGFEMHLLDESQRRFRRVRTAVDWCNQFKGEYANLYCVRRDRAISVCFFSHLSGLAGAERTLLELVDALVAKYGAVCAVVLPGPGPLATALSRAGAACIFGYYQWWCWLGPKVSDEARDRHFDKNVKSLVRFAMPALRELDPDVIWTQTMVIPWGAVIAAQMAKPHVWYVTELGELDHGFTFFEPFRAVIEDLAYSSDQVFTCSQFISDTLFPNAPNEQVRVLYCYIPPPSTEAPGQVHANYFDIKGAVRLGIFANSSTKGTQDIVRAVAQLTARGRNVELLVAGHEDADFQQKLLEIIRTHDIHERVKFVGFLPDPYSAMKATDIVVVCSRNEAFGRVGVEAMLLGKPVVYPTTGGVSEYMVERKTGYSYKPGNIEELVDRLETLMEQRSHWDEMRNFSRTRALQLFGDDGYSGEVYRTLQKLRREGRKAKGMPKGTEKFMGRFAEYVNVPRNDPCPCGSGKRYKHCHGWLA